MNAASDKFDITAIYACGKIEQRIEDIARSTGLPADELTRRVAELLLGTQGGEALGADHSLPHLRTNGTRPGRQVKRQKMAMAGRPRNDATPMREWSLEAKREYWRAEARRRRERKAAENGRPLPPIEQGLKGFSYQGTHWTQRPENRAKMMKRIREMHKVKKGKRA